MLGAVGRVGRERRCRRCRGWPGSEDSMMALTDSSAIAVARADHGEPANEMCHIWCLSELDPLTLTLTLTPYPDAILVGCDVMEDLMLEEFAVSLAASRTARGSSLGR